MLNKRKNIFLLLLCCSLLTCSSIAFENKVYAQGNSESSDMLIFGDKHNATPIKPWIINTSVPIDASCLKDAVTITDNNNVKAEVSFSTTNNDKSIVITPPNGGYRNGQTYTLNISKNLKSKDKKYSLKHPCQMKFTVNKKCINEVNITKDSPVTKANNSFSLNLIKNLEENNSEKNIVISPFSVSSLLALTQNGALDQTKKEILTTIGFNEVYPIDLNGDYKNIFDYYTNLPTDPIQISNSIWLNKDFQINKDFTDTSKQYYYSQISSLDFSKDNSAEIINDWASKSTNGQIKELIKELDPNALSIFSNCVHFKGAWINEFDSKSTEPKEFTLSNGTKLKNVPMMQDKRHVPYYKGDNFSTITLSYYDNLEMNLFLPDKNVSIDSFMKNMTKENFDKWMDKLQSREVICKIPKFKINCDEDLKEPLKNLGMKAIFNPQNCNLSKISNNMYVDKITHKTAISVDEKGTEASAVTTEHMNGACAPQDTPPEFIADRPFFFTIRDTKTGIILFMGKVENPTK